MITYLFVSYGKFVSGKICIIAGQSCDEVTIMIAHGWEKDALNFPKEKTPILINHMKHFQEQSNL